MSLDNLKLQERFGKSIILNEDLSKYSWFNLGGPAKVFFKPSSKEQLIEFLVHVKKNLKIINLGAGSNTLIRDGGIEGAVIKLSKKFSFINPFPSEVLEVGAATLDKTLSRFASDNSISGFEFLSCIPGSVGGGIIMNSGCYGQDISKILISVKTINFEGKEKEFKRDEIKFSYRGSNLPKNIIILSAKFQGHKKSQKEILNKMNELNNMKKSSQPSQIKTCGSTFKNPKNEKAWKLIKDSGCEDISFGKASISKKHCNFFVNEGGASSDEIEKLINLVKERVFKKFKIELDLEINLIGESKNV